MSRKMLIDGEVEGEQRFDYDLFVIGAGSGGVELRGPLPVWELRGFDDEMREVVARNLLGRGINLHPGTNISELHKTEDGISVVLDQGDEFMADVWFICHRRQEKTVMKLLVDSETGASMCGPDAAEIMQVGNPSIRSFFSLTPALSPNHHLPISPYGHLRPKFDINGCDSPVNAVTKGL